VKSFTFLLDYFRSNNNNVQSKKRGTDNITIRGFFDTSLPGIIASTAESELFESLLNEWAPGNLDNYESVTFELTFANNSKQTTDYEKIISQQLNGKSSKYDFFMLDCVWTGKYGNHLIDLQGKINSKTVNMHVPVSLNTCKYNEKLKALVIFLNTYFIYYILIIFFY